MSKTCRVCGYYTDVPRVGTTCEANHATQDPSVKWGNCDVCSSPGVVGTMCAGCARVGLHIPIEDDE